MYIECQGGENLIASRKVRLHGVFGDAYNRQMSYHGMGTVITTQEDAEAVAAYNRLVKEHMDLCAKKGLVAQAAGTKSMRCVQPTKTGWSTIMPVRPMPLPIKPARTLYRPKEGLHPAAIAGLAVAGTLAVVMIARRL